jgi:hypothetical protein
MSPTVDLTASGALTERADEDPIFTPVRSGSSTPIISESLQHRRAGIHGQSVLSVVDSERDVDFDSPFPDAQEVRMLLGHSV